MTSSNGVAWTGQTAAAASDWRSVTFGNGLFVALSFDKVMTSSCLASSTSTATTATATPETSSTASSTTYTATTGSSTKTTTTTTSTITKTTTTTTTIDEAKRGSGSNPGTTALAVLAVLAVLTFIFAVALLVLVTRIRSLSAQIAILQQEARGNRRERVQTTSNPLHQGDDNTYEDPVFGQETIYTQAKMEKAVAPFEEPYEMLDSGAQTYAMGTTTATLA
jgi:hypothetical protein